MKPLTQLILIFLLTFTVVPVYADYLSKNGVIVSENNYEGMWACMETKSFGYLNGEVKHYKEEKFILKIKEDTVSYSGDEFTLGKGTLKILNKKLNSINLTAFGPDGLFKFKDKKFIWVSAFNNKRVPPHPIIILALVRSLMPQSEYLCK